MSTQNQATRTEKDTMGNVEVPADAYWGAQTQRSRGILRKSVARRCRVR